MSDEERGAGPRDPSPTPAPLRSAKAKGKGKPNVVLELEREAPETEDEIEDDESPPSTPGPSKFKRFGGTRAGKVNATERAPSQATLNPPVSQIPSLPPSAPFRV